MSTWILHTKFKQATKTKIQLSSCIFCDHDTIFQRKAYMHRGHLGFDSLFETISKSLSTSHDDSSFVFKIESKSSFSIDYCDFCCCFYFFVFLMSPENPNALESNETQR